MSLKAARLSMTDTNKADVYIYVVQFYEYVGDDSTASRI